MSTFLSLSICCLKVSFTLHCSSAQSVKSERQKLPKKMAKQRSVSKCHSLHCDCVDVSSHLGCCCWEFVRVASPATEHWLSISAVTYSFLVTLCWFRQNFCYSLHFKVSPLHTLLCYLLWHCNFQKPLPSSVYHQLPGRQYMAVFYSIVPSL